MQMYEIAILRYNRVHARVVEVKTRTEKTKFGS